MVGDCRWLGCIDLVLAARTIESLARAHEAKVLDVVTTVVTDTLESVRTKVATICTFTSESLAIPYSSHSTETTAKSMSVHPIFENAQMRG